MNTNESTLNSDLVLHQTMKSTSPNMLLEGSVEVDEEKPMVYAYLKGTNDSHYVLEKRRIIIGKDPDKCDVVLHNGKTISPQHAKIEFRKTSSSYTCIISDLQTQNGTLVNDKRLYLDSVTKQLRHGDRIRFGFDQVYYTIEFLFEEEQPTRISTDERGFVGILNPDFKPGKARRSRSAEKALSRPRVEPSKEYKDKLNRQQQDFKSLLEKRRSEKKAEKDPSTITFQTATGSKTVSLNDLQESEDDSMDEDPKTNLKPEPKQQEDVKKVNIQKNPNFDTLYSRIEGLEKTIYTDQKNEEQESYHLNLLVNTVHLLSYRLMNDLGKEKTIQEDFHQTLDTNTRTIREIMADKLKDVKTVLTNCIERANSIDAEKEKSLKEKERSRSQALERYATDLQLELDSIRFEYERKNMIIEELKRSNGDRKKDQDTIKTLRECIEFKDSEMKDLQSQLASNSLIGYNSETAKSRMQNLIATLMKDTEECKKRNIESQHRLDKRLLEWQQVKEENKKLRYRVSDLQETIHRQMNDLHISLMHKEQKLNAWKSKVAELSSDNNEMRYRASSFLLSLISEQDSKDTELLLKYEEVKRNLHFSQMENNEQRMEIQNLKDVLQYTDIHTTKQTMDMLKDKIHQMEVECSVERVLEYQNTISNLSARVSEYERMQGLYQQEFFRLKKLNTKFNEDACIGTMERKLQLYEKKIEMLEKHIEQTLVERESPILMNPIPISRNDIRSDLMKETSSALPKPVSLKNSRTPSRTSSKTDLLNQVENIENVKTLEEKERPNLPLEDSTLEQENGIIPATIETVKNMNESN